MSHSKGTTNYNLPLFTKDDRPAWLTDFNSAMMEVDNVMKRTSDAARPDLLEAAQQEAAAAMEKATDAQTKANGALQKSGGTMTGNLILNAAPTSDLQAATKKYVDEHAGGGGVSQEYVDAQVATRLPLNGGTMTGNLILNAAPTSDLQAATKKYVDGHAGGGVSKEYVDTQVGTRLPLNGGTMTGVLTLSGAPTSDLQASTKKYVDDQIKLNITDVINASY